MDTRGRTRSKTKQDKNKGKINGGRMGIGDEGLFIYGFNVGKKGSKSKEEKKVGKKGSKVKEEKKEVQRTVPLTRKGSSRKEKGKLEF